MRPEFVARWGEDAAQAEVEFWEVLVSSLASGAPGPTHVRERRPSL
jgi:hypothetical protein